MSMKLARVANARKLALVPSLLNRVEPLDYVFVIQVSSFKT